MVNVMLAITVVIFAAMISTKISQKIGIPTLILFIALGLLFGTDGLLKLEFDNYELVEIISSTALVILIFYGGFGTRWKTAKPIAVKALTMSTLGVVLTAGLVGLFCHYVLYIDLLESFLIGSVISSTDAPSVFAILKQKKLSLKYQSAPLLELESGSNDPTAYMLTIMVLEMMSKPQSYDKYIIMIIVQFVVGILCAVILAKFTMFVIRRFHLETNDMSLIFYFAMVLLSYALPAKFGGNGYLSTYIFGIIIGNKYISNKRVIMHFFDGITALVQLGVFFVLGLLAIPSQMPSIMLISLYIALFLSFVARPIAAFLILKPLGCPMNQVTLISFAGIRGVASIVFAIVATMHPAVVENDLFHIVFCIVIFSITIQGAFLPIVSKILRMVDEGGDVLKTFTDYEEETEIQFIRLRIGKDHPWNNFKLKNITLPPDVIVLVIMRGKERIIPNGDTLLISGDVLVLAAPGFDDTANIGLNEINIYPSHDWVDKEIKDIKISPNVLIAIVKRGDEVIIPKGDTFLTANDKVVLLDNDD